MNREYENYQIANEEFEAFNSQLMKLHAEKSELQDYLRKTDTHSRIAKTETLLRKEQMYGIRHEKRIVSDEELRKVQEQRKQMQLPVTEARERKKVLEEMLKPESSLNKEKHRLKSVLDQASCAYWKTVKDRILENADLSKLVLAYVAYQRSVTGNQDFTAFVVNEVSLPEALSELKPILDSAREELDERYSLKAVHDNAA